MNATGLKRTEPYQQFWTELRNRIEPSGLRLYDDYGRVIYLQERGKEGKTITAWASGDEPVWYVEAMDTATDEWTEIGQGTQIAAPHTPDDAATIARLAREILRAAARVGMPVDPALLS